MASDAMSGNLPMRRLAMALAALAVILIGGVAVAIAFGGPVQPPPMQSVNDPFASIDFSDVAPIQRFGVRDGTRLSYRTYCQASERAKGSVILIHDSSARSESIHPMARSLARAGYVAYAIDMRGHGQSGTTGQIAYIGQLEDDLEDFLKAVRLAGKKSLVGFSAGGGFSLRFAADSRRELLDNYLLLAPFLSQDASTYRPATGDWDSVGMPRIIALTPAAQKLFTPSYSFAPATNFRPRPDYRADIAAARQPKAVLVGQNDDQYYPERFAAEVSAAGRNVPVSIVPGTGHIELSPLTRRDPSRHRIDQPPQWRVTAR